MCGLDQGKEGFRYKGDTSPLWGKQCIWPPVEAWAKCTSDQLVERFVSVGEEQTLSWDNNLASSFRETWQLIIQSMQDLLPGQQSLDHTSWEGQTRWVLQRYCFTVLQDQSIDCSIAQIYQWSTGYEHCRKQNSLVCSLLRYQQARGQESTALIRGDNGAPERQGMETDRRSEHPDNRDASLRSVHCTRSEPVQPRYNIFSSLWVGGCCKTMYSNGYV